MPERSRLSRLTERSKPLAHLTNPIWSAADWHRRAAALFMEADRTESESAREQLRRRAQAAQMLGDGMVDDKMSGDREDAQDADETPVSHEAPAIPGAAIPEASRNPTVRVFRQDTMSNRLMYVVLLAIAAGVLLLAAHR